MGVVADRPGTSPLRLDQPDAVARYCGNGDYGWLRGCRGQRCHRDVGTSVYLGLNLQRRSVARAADISGVSFVAATSETVAVVTTIAFGANTRQPWSLAVTNGIAGGGFAVMDPDADDQNSAEEWYQPGEYRLQRFLGGAIHIRSYQAHGRDDVQGDRNDQEKEEERYG